MARGSEAKKNITDRILETFEGSFLYNGDKEIRIPYNESGEYLEIKVTLTCAKESVGGGNVPSGETVSAAPAATPVTEPTQEELDNISNLIASLNL